MFKELEAKAAKKAPAPLPQATSLQAAAPALQAAAPAQATAPAGQEDGAARFIKASGQTRADHLL